ncbi:MAG: hypothetical protein IT560_14850 [Alphaproteobacteria bacterium]|nr:hypothetical protein [Alphaproteobacteria bacterium]
MIRSFYRLALLSAFVVFPYGANADTVIGIENVSIKNPDGTTTKMSMDEYNARKNGTAQPSVRDEKGTAKNESDSRSKMEKYRAERAAAAGGNEMYVNADGSKSQTPTDRSLLVQFGSEQPAAQPTAVQQQAANAVMLAQGQVPAAPAAPATGVAAASADATHPGVVPGVSPSTAPAPESKDDIQKPFSRSLFYTKQDLVQISKALNGQSVNIDAPVTGGSGEMIPQVRTITLTGVLYKGPGDWLIWLNGQKLNPRNLLREIYEIEVFKDSRVRLKWYDIGLDGVIDVTLRPHQKYDIVTGLLLPAPQE